MDNREIILGVYQTTMGRVEYWQDERSKTVNLAVVFATVLTTVIGIDEKIDGPIDLILSCFIVVTGVVGWVFTLKTHERVEESRAIARTLVEGLGVAAISNALATAKTANEEKYGVSFKLKFYRVYLFLMGMMTVFGLALALIAGDAGPKLMPMLSC